MNTILISGTSKSIPIKSKIGVSFKVEYNIIIWASKEGDQLQFVTAKDGLVNCEYGDLWSAAKEIVSAYFKEPLFNDGAYTTFLDHLITV